MFRGPPVGFHGTGAGADRPAQTIRAPRPPPVIPRRRNLPMQRKRSFVRGLVAAMALLSAVPAAMVLGASPASAAPGPVAPSGCPTVQVDSVEVVRTTTGPGLLVQGT